MILIVKAGTTFQKIKSKYCDFEDWIIDKMSLKTGEFLVYTIVNYDDIPIEQAYAGIIITGSHEMVTDINPSATNFGKWLLSMHHKSIPILGICYGHQFLAVLFGGVVDYNKTGIEIGSVLTYLNRAGKSDPLLSALPQVCKVYKAHRQSITIAPTSGKILAVSELGIIDAIRYNDHTWGVQFHPEFNIEITRSYIHEQIGQLTGEGLDVTELSKSLENIDYGTEMFNNFRKIVSG